uniref:Rad21/Rec8-like protein N-terminal domain-containing protein n=1 Tax=Oryzias latipes TaxID=8090 RepID=A0A3B3HB52_ORYLA
MFYYPAVLKRHSGSFSTIWLVATKGIKVPRRDFLKVNVKSTCDDIMNYVLERVPPPAPGLPKPRFSLYLSSQLQYGVVVVYHRQCAILLEELQFIVTQLLKQRDTQKIDLPDHSRQPVLLSDAVSLMEETEGALDPLFGVMHLQDPMPSPGAIIQVEKHVLEFSDVEGKKKKTIQKLKNEPLCLSDDSGFSEKTFFFSVCKATKLLICDFPLHQGDPAEVAVKRRRRRQLVFFDPETQLSQEEQQQRIGNPLVETRPPLLLPPPAHRVLPASELFNNPCNSQQHASGGRSHTSLSLKVERHKKWVFPWTLTLTCPDAFVCRFLPAVEEEPVLFQSLLPANVDRRTVSGVFQRLLGKAAV